MPDSYLKNFLKHISNKLAYPHARIAFGSRVTGGTVLGSNIVIEPGCYVFGSTLGDNVQLKEGCTVFHSRLENNVTIHPHVVVSDVEFAAFSYVAEISQMSSVSVGRFCSIGPHFLCGYGEHPTDFVSTSPVFYSTRSQCGTTFASRNYFQETRKTTIGHDVWIGARVFARDGVKVGNGALIAAGAAVVSDIPDYAIAGGVPAKVIRYRFPEPIISELLRLEWWNWPEEKLCQAQPWFAQNDIKAFLDWARKV